MAKNKTNEVEIKLDRVIIAGLIQQLGPDLNRLHVWQIVNAERYRRYKKAALEAGKTPEEAEIAGRYAQVTRVTINKEIRLLAAAAQQAGLAGAAVFLDSQARDVQDEIEATHSMDLEIWEDLRRSRGEGWTRTKGNAPKEGGAIKPTEIVRHRRTSKLAGEDDEKQEGAAQAALFARLQENSRQRMKLRQEALRLRGLAQYVPAAAPGEELRTLTEIVMNIDDPVAARKAALRAIAEEIADLQAGASIPFDAEMAALERLRLAKAEATIGRLLDYVRLPEKVVTPDGSNSFELIYERVEPKRLKAAPEEGE